MHYLLLYDVGPDYIRLREKYRNEHLILAWEAHSRGELVLGGALSDPADGAVLLFQGDSPEPAIRFASQDPYVKNGIVVKWRVRNWMTVVGKTASSPVRPAG